MKLVDAVLGIVDGQKGQEEHPRGSNRGPMVTLYQNRTGYPGGGVAWCLCFCYWCIDEACRAATVANVLKKTGSCDVLLEWAKEHGVLHTDPKPGDIGLVLARPGCADAVHAFFVTSVAGGKIKTMEGNSNNDGSREGYVVVPRSRAISPKIVYVRWADLAGFQGVAGKAPLGAAVVDPTPPPTERAGVVIAGTKIGDFEVVDGETLVPVRETLGHLAPKGREGEVAAGLAWDGESRTLSLGEHVLNSQVTVRDGVSYGHIRKVVDLANEAFATHWTLSKSGAVITIA